MLHLYAALLLLSGGVVFGWALATWKRRLAMSVGFLVVAGFGAALLIPQSREVMCRFARELRSEGAHPPELVGAWVGWDANYATPYCRLELEPDGTGRCAMWYGRERVEAWRVTRWSFFRAGIEIDLESGEQRERMRGKVFEGSMSLKYFGSDGPEVTRNWLGPLHLVPEGPEREARRAVREVLDPR